MNTVHKINRIIIEYLNDILWLTSSNYFPYFKKRIYKYHYQLINNMLSKNHNEIEKEIFRLLNF